MTQFRYRSKAFDETKQINRIINILFSTYLEKISYEIRQI